MKRVLVVTFLTLTLASPAISPKVGKQRLRELAVFPSASFTWKLGFTFSSSINELADDTSLTNRIEETRREIKETPGDIERQIRLGALLAENGETNVSKQCFEKAVALCRTRAESHPQDGLVLTHLGRALAALNKVDESESVYRRATMLSSNEWKCWAGLGEFLDQRSFGLIVPEKFWSYATSGSALPPEVLDFRPPADAFERARKLSAEAAPSFDRAVSLAPKEPDVFLRRAMHFWLADLTDRLIKHLEGRKTFDANLLAAAWGKSVPDLWEAVKLSPETPRLIGLAAWFEWVGAGPADPKDRSFDTLPEATRKSIHDAMNRLERLGDHPNQKLAAQALEAAAILKLAAGDAAGSVKDLRRVVSLDPSRDNAWELLVGALAHSSAPSEQLVTACESRLKLRKSARNHLLLAKALVKQHRWERAAEEARVALKLETNNIPAHLMAAALVIRQNGELAEAMKHLYAVNDALDALPDNEERWDRLREYLLNGAIVSALNDQPKEAKEWVNLVLKRDPDDDEAKEILSAIK
jgi:tetratricopeptide (TPR) repeat protein